MAIHPLGNFDLPHHHALAGRNVRLKKRHPFFMTLIGSVGDTDGKDQFNHLVSSQKASAAKCGPQIPRERFLHDTDCNAFLVPYLPFLHWQPAKPRQRIVNNP
jgi:hypothetical protein